MIQMTMMPEDKRWQEWMDAVGKAKAVTYGRGLYWVTDFRALGWPTWGTVFTLEAIIK